MFNETLICERIIKEKGLTITTAESLTGGLLASEFVSLAGSSAWFLEGCVTYIVPAKVSRLCVKQETVDKYTVVSEQVALEMARGIRKNLNSDIGISTTGYAGPTGGDDINPVGTVFVGISCKKGDRAIRLSLSGNRNEVRSQAVHNAIKLLEETLENWDKGE